MSSHAPYHRYVKQLGLPLWERTCLFEAGVGKNINGNMFALLRELCTNPSYQDYQPVMSVVDTMLDAARARLAAYGLQRVRVVTLESDEYNEYLARAKYLFNDNTFPAYFTKRPDQIYLNTWHGTPLKRLGMSDIANSLRSFANVQKNLLTADYDLFPNVYTRDVFMEDYDLAPFYAGTSLVCDYPRNDVLADETLYAEVREREGIATGHQAIAYMPTWRGLGRVADSEGQIGQITQSLRDIDAGLDDHQTLFVNLHFTVQGSVDFSSFQHVRPFPTHYETYDFLAACDVLVSDYSSVMFDYAVTGRPIVLFAYDENEYMTDKGTYFPYRDLPFPIVDNAPELVRAIDEPACSHAYADFQKRYCSHHSGHAARDVLALVLDGDQGHLDVTQHHPASIDEALYVFSMGKQRVREAVLDQIIERAGSDTGRNIVLVTTASYSDGAIEAFKQLFGKVHMLVITRRRVQTRRERVLFDQVSEHKSVARLLEGSLRGYYQREASQTFCGVKFDRFCALAPDGSYPMWIAKGTDAQLVAEMKSTTVVGKKALRAARVCVATGYTPTRNA